MKIQKEIKCVPARQSKAPLKSSMSVKPLSPFFHTTKASLFTSRQPGDVHVVSRDARPDNGAKNFAWFPSGASIASFLEDNGKGPDAHFHEVIINKKEYRTYIGFDIDRALDSVFDADILADQEAYYSKLHSAFERTFTAFLKHVYNAPNSTIMSLGVTHQVCYSITNAKVSCHIRVNIPCVNYGLVEQVARNYDTFLSSDNVSPDDRKFFYYYKDDKYECVIDTAIYSKFRSIRAVYSSKWKKGGAPLIPYGCSSPNVADHLFHVHGDEVNAFPKVCIDEPVRVEYRKPHKKIKTIIHTKVMPFDDDDIIEAPEGEQRRVQQVQEMLINNKDVQKHFNGTLSGFKSTRWLSPRCCAMYTEKCHCPYANRTHTNNRSYFEFLPQKNLVRYKCFDENCCSTQKTHGIAFEVDEAAHSANKRLLSMTTNNTIHDCDELIKWDKVYSLANGMKAYPLKPIVCIRGNMGTGKTDALKTFIPKHCEGKRCLFITYQRLLSHKYDSMFGKKILGKQHGFVNYLDKHGDYNIYDEKVIICLDSLHRISLTEFDFIFIDEALSVFLHMNSNLMQQSTLVSSKLEGLLRESKHIYLLDACIDNSIVHDVVEYISKAKNVSPYWIKNTWVRPTNRSVQAIVCTNKGIERQLAPLAMTKVVDLLSDGKRVVVSSSSKWFTDNLSVYLHEVFKDSKAISVHNSETDNSMLCDNVETYWSQYDCVIYSPTVSAGVSFCPEAAHFDQLVAYIKNSDKTPTVDTALQQLFRVRKLKDGDMHLFVQCTDTFEHSEHPIDDASIDRWLQTNVETLHNHYPDSISPKLWSSDSKKIMYDDSLLSYKILRGIVKLRHKSLTGFCEILLKTLSEDYLIPCTSKSLNEVESDLDTIAIDIYTQLKSIKSNIEVIKFDSSLIIDSTEYTELTNRLKSGNVLTDKDRLRRWIFDASKLWGIPPKKVDKDFYNSYIGPCDAENIRSTIDYVYTAKRVGDLVGNNLTKNQVRFATRLEEIKYKGNDVNIELFKVQSHTYFKKLLHGQFFLEKLLPNGFDKRGLLQGQNISMTAKEMDTKIRPALSSMSAAKYNDLLSTFPDLKRTYKCRDKILSNSRALYHFVKKVLEEAFNIDVFIPKQSGVGNTKTNNRCINAIGWTYIADKYNPQCLGRSYTETSMNI